MTIPVVIIIMIIGPSIANNYIRYKDEAFQFAEDFEDICELAQPLYYFNFDTSTMIYITDESYDCIRGMWRYIDENDEGISSNGQDTSLQN